MGNFVINPISQRFFRWTAPWALMAMLASQACAAGSMNDLSGLLFSDGREHSLSEFENKALLVVYFSGQCPNAAEYMRETARKRHDLIEGKMLPARMLCVTPDLSQDDLKEWAESMKLTHALVASDPRNRMNISLNNILRVAVYAPASTDSAGSSVPREESEFETFLQSKGQYTIAPPQSDSAPVRQLWWDVECNRPTAIKNLLDGAKRPKIKEQAAPIVDALKSKVAQRQDELSAASPTMETYEALESFLARYNGLNLAASLARLKELARLPEISAELKSRDIFRQCQAKLSSPNQRIQKEGTDALAELAKRYPETVYGKRAAAR